MKLNFCIAVLNLKASLTRQKGQNPSLGHLKITETEKSGCETLENIMHAYLVFLQKAKKSFQFSPSFSALLAEKLAAGEWTSQLNSSKMDIHRQDG